MKKESNQSFKIEPGSKLPLILFLLTAVILSCLFMLVTILSSGFTLTLSKEHSEGDLNNDGALNATDALHIIMKENNAIKFNGAQIDAADLNNDGKIDDIDAALIVQYSSQSSKKIGVLSPGVTSMDKPASEIKNQSAASDNTIQSPTGKKTHSGKSYLTTFSKSDAGALTSAQIVNVWQTDSQYFYQIELTVKNRTGAPLKDSDMVLEFNKKPVVEKLWDCTTTDMEYELIVNTQNYGYIENGSEIKCGMVVSSNEPVEIKSFKYKETM